MQISVVQPGPYVTATGIILLATHMHMHMRYSKAMAGLGLFFHKTALALAPRGLLQSAYDFLCLIYTKRSRASRKGPGQF
jgi:hypothetical protein